MFKIKKIEEKKVFYSDLLDCEHFFTTRELIVKDNIELISKYLKIKPQNLIKPSQVHSANIETVKENKKDYPECDALILDRKDCAIYLNFADCTPVILFDRKNKTGAIAHAGWRGTAQQIAPKTVLKMKEIYNTNPEDIIALIGPCIGFECFETSSEAILKLKNTIKDTKGLFRDNFADLKGINKRQLEDIGVKDFDICPYCTICDNDKFFSYRKENQTKNRHSAVLKLG